MSDFKDALDACKATFTPHEITWVPTVEDWQEIISKSGYNITAASCTVVTIGEYDYLFSDGPAFWQGDTGRGPAGMLLLVLHRPTNIYHTSDKGKLFQGIFATSEFTKA